MCKAYYYGTIGNQGYHIEDTQPKGRVGQAEQEENYRAEVIEAKCKIRERKERENFKGYD